MNAPFRILNRPEKLRLRVEDFELLEEGGAFGEFSKAELIDGDIYIVKAQFARHGRAKMRLLYALMKRLEEIGGDLEAFSEVSVRVAADSMPEPDIFLAQRQDYGPVPVASVALVIEVADTTLDTDMGRKAVLYAATGIPEYWVVDLDSGRVVIHHRPEADGYRDRSKAPFGRPLAAATIEGLDLSAVKLIE